MKDTKKHKKKKHGILVKDFQLPLNDDIPITTGNFKNLVSRGIYDGTIFHQVVRNFVIQGGDPTLTGHGDLSIPSIQDELPNRHSNIEGVVAMAKTKQPNSATIPFFLSIFILIFNKEFGFINSFWVQP